MLTDSSVVVLVSGKVDLKCLGGKQTSKKWLVCQVCGLPKRFMVLQRSPSSQMKYER